MNKKHLKRLHLKQRQIFANFRKQVRNRTFECHTNNPQILIKNKLYFLHQLKLCLKRAFRFNSFQAEFVKNEAMSKVLHPHHIPERMLVSQDPRTAEKLVHTSYVLGHHYFRFIMTMF